jgi:anti-sigma B factor antagonist
MNGLHTNTRRLCPQGEMTIYTAAGQKLELMQALDNGEGIELDLSKVTEMDTAGLQLLILARLETGLRGLPLDIVDRSQAVMEVIDTCNLSGFLFGEPELILPGLDSGEAAQ